MLSIRVPRKAVAIIGIIGFCFLLYLFLQSLGVVRPKPVSFDSIELTRLLVGLVFCYAVIWAGIGRWFSIPFLLGIFFLTALAFAVVPDKSFVLLGGLYCAVYALMRWHERTNRGQLLSDKVEVEKNEGEINQLEAGLVETKNEQDASLQKYNTYYGLREVAERFATTLELDKLANMVVDELRNFLPKGDAYLLYLTELDEGNLSLVASLTEHEEEKVKGKQGEIFDLWVLKNRQPLLVTDTRKDVRFDSKQLPDPTLRSLISTPLISEGRVVGSCRVHSSVPNLFTQDDLRVLDALVVLASSAVANARLFRRTEELAIRDSLTGLFVQRYFKDRLKEEHRRALLTNAPLSYLMCDLDFFKSFNDRFGHSTGDLMLMRVAEVIMKESPEDAIVARYGGEEFAVLLPRISKQEAIDLGKRIVHTLQSERLEIRRELTQITISIGVSTLPDDTLEREELIRIADQNLYQSKRKGRNQVSPVAP